QRTSFRHLFVGFHLTSASSDIGSGNDFHGKTSKEKRIAVVSSDSARSCADLLGEFGGGSKTDGNRTATPA
ncbi:unnamed protein product, partial [Amoebophrya sp. A25]